MSVQTPESQWIPTRSLHASRSQQASEPGCFRPVTISPRTLRDKYKKLAARTLFVLAVASFSVVLSACPKVISLDYRASTSLKGQGQIQVESFLYAAAESDGLRSKEIESNPEALGTFYMSQDIAALFTDAVKSELQFAGYEVVPDQDRVVTGVVERFYYNWVGTEEKTFELKVEYTVRSGDSIVYAQTFRSLERRPKALVTGGAMMKSAIKDCIEQFIRGAQEAGVL